MKFQGRHYVFCKVVYIGFYSKDGLQPGADKLIADGYSSITETLRRITHPPPESY